MHHNHTVYIFLMFVYGYTVRGINKLPSTGVDTDMGVINNTYEC